MKHIFLFRLNFTHKLNASSKLASSCSFLILFFSLQNLSAQENWIAQPPALSQYCKIDKNGATVIPNGRILTPLGKQIMTAPHPYGLVLSKDGSIAVTANSGITPFSITVIKNPLSENPQVQQIPEGAKTDNGVLEACFMGLAITSDNKKVYVAGGETNKIFVFDLDKGTKIATIDCAISKENDHGYIGDMLFSKDEKTLYALDQIGFRLIKIDVDNQRVIQNIPTGRYPFGLCLSPDEKKVFVANVGVFEYKPFTDLDPKNLKRTAHDYPSTKYNSPEMINGIPEKGVPALGSPNAPEAFSVWCYDLTQKTPTVIAKVKTGFLVGEKIEDFPTVGGSSPNSVIATDKYVFVSNGNNDCISVLDIDNQSVIKNIYLNIDERLKGLRGIIPFGLTLSPDKKRLFIAEAGINAVAVIDVASLSVLGHLPTGWFPSKLQVSPDGKKMLVANAKGFGSGPNGGSTFTLGKEGSYIGSLMKGSVSVFDIPQDADFKGLSKKVCDNNVTFISQKTANLSKTHPIPLFPDERVSPIKHIVFISKENRTYDEVFGQLTTGNGEAALARYGENISFSNKKKTKSVEKGNIMSNHLALARRFAISDNFYCDSDVSADGHRWLVATYPNEWCETGTAAAYGGRRDLKENSKAPGNLAFYGSAGSIYPEDYNEAGSMWEHLERNKIEFYNFGFGVEMAANFQDSTMKYAGEKYLVNYPISAPLFDRTSRIFPTYNMSVPDQFRTDLFIKEYNEKWTKGNLPSVITLMLPNDHGSSERPNAGWPFTESYMADNDLAVGRTIEFLSHTPYWKNMAIVITEDDPQGGVDHIDAHRSLLMVISPYAKKNYNGHQHYSFGSIFKTFWHILGIPYLNQYDATAADMSDLFTETPDFTPYNAIAADPRIFDAQKALDPFDEKFDWKAFQASEELDRTETMQQRREDDDKEERKKKKKWWQRKK